MSFKPHVILVPGAWHKPEAYAPLTNDLQLAGYRVTGVTTPSVVGYGEEPMPDFGADVEAVRSAIKGAVDAGDKVAVIGHSYGGIPASEGIKGFEKDVHRMIYLCAFAVPVGKSLMDMLAGGPPLEWIVPEGNSLKAIKNKEIFYNDISEEEAETHAASLLLHSPGSMNSKATYAAFEHVPSTYIICQQDAAIPPAAQEAMSSQRGKWIDSPIMLNAGHIPFLAKKDETVRAVRKALGESV